MRFSLGMRCEGGPPVYFAKSAQAAKGEGDTLVYTGNGRMRRRLKTKDGMLRQGCEG
jgi:hypothetical protein